jgi:hypothetical protein
MSRAKVLAASRWFRQHVGVDRHRDDRASVAEALTDDMHRLDGAADGRVTEAMRCRGWRPRTLKRVSGIY